MLKNKSRDYIDNLCFFCWVLLASIPKLHSINQQYNISNCIVREPISPLSFMALVIYPSPSYLALLSSYFTHSELKLPNKCKNSCQFLTNLFLLKKTYYESKKYWQ